MMNSILIVEDDPVISELLSWRLKKLGYEVSGTAQSAYEALRQIEANPPDIILIDIMLQGEMDGIDLARQINIDYSIPFIYVTAYSDNETISRVIDTEPRGFLLKPFKDEDLKVAIELALKRVRSD